MTLDSGFATAPVVITGCQRSGTTLLRVMLGKHGALLEHPDEPQFILELYKRHGRAIKNTAAAISYITNHRYASDSVSYLALKEALQLNSELPLRDLIQAYIRIWAGDSVKNKRPILKDPALILHLPLVRHLFPEATIVHIIRDPRANAFSQIIRWPRITVWQASQLWKRAVTLGQEWAKTQEIQYVEVRYEDLVQNPTKELQSLCQHLQITYTSEMLSFEQDTTLFAPDGTPRQVTHRTVDPSRLYLWKEHLTATDIRLIEHCCREEMKVYSYPLQNPIVPFRPYTIRLIREWAYYRFKMSGKVIKAIWRKLLWRLNLSG